MTLSLGLVAGVWIAGAVWSFEEQTAFAASAGFLVPWLLPLTLDGLALALATVAGAASLDGRTAFQARLGTALAIASSAASNAWWAWERTGTDISAVVLAAGVPLASFMAFETLLSEIRRQVHRHRGLPAPVMVPAPRLIRVGLSPRRALREWRAYALQVTAPGWNVAPVDPLLAEATSDVALEGGPTAAGTIRSSSGDRELDTAPDLDDPRNATAERTTPPPEPPQRQGRRRTIEQLRVDLASAIDAGTLPAQPSLWAIRTTLGVGLERARQLRGDTA